MIVVDTHVLIWFGQGDDRLGAAARDLIERSVAGQGAKVPAICAWEIALIERRGDVPFLGGALIWFSTMLALPGFSLVPLLPVIAFESVRLEWRYRDPADRIIVATAKHLEMPLLTSDREILSYAAAGHVQAIDARR